MLRRGIVCGALLLAGVTAAPAGAHDGQLGQRAQFPALPSGKHARAIEARERGIEVSALGNEHAAEHAEGRSLAGRLRERKSAHYGLGSGGFTQALAPDNSIPVDQGGRWEPSVSLPMVAINAIQLHTGKILYFAYPWRATEPDPATGTAGTPQNWDTADAYLFDPTTGRSQAVPPPINPTTGKRVELFCAGASLMDDGRVLITGGNVGNPAGDGVSKQNYGLNTTYVFDPDAAAAGQNPWTEGPRMRQGRWYPTQTLTPDGSTIITSGQANSTDQDKGQVNKDVNVFRSDGTLERWDYRLDGTDGRLPTPGQYPHSFWMPTGRLFTAGPFKPDTWAIKPPADLKGPGTVTDLPNLPTHREWAGGVLVPGSPASKVLLIGGADRTDTNPPARSDALGTTSWFDEAEPQAGWRAGPNLTAPRAFANTVLLPTGKVAVVGGGTGDRNDTRYYRWLFGDAQRHVEILDPTKLGDATAKPVLGNAQAEGRTYHSTALLLPDGRVWSAGDDVNGPLANPNPDSFGGPLFTDAQKRGGGSGVCRDTAEVWTPPYLLNADGTPKARPVIADAPSAGAYGSTIGVRATGNVTSAVLVAPGATTHANDMSQRLIALPTPTQVPGRGVNVRLPSSLDAAPPSYYMLFLMDANGTPSVARFIRLVRGGTPDPKTLSGSDAATLPQSQPAQSNPSTPPSQSTISCGELPPNTDPAPETTPSPSPTQTPVATQPPSLVPETPRGASPAKRLRVGVQLSLAATLDRLTAARRYSVVVTTTRAAKVRVSSAVQVRRTVRRKGKRRIQVVRLPIAIPRIVTFKRAGAKRIRVALSKGGLQRLRARKTATLRITVKGSPKQGKPVTVVRRPELR